jgi:hypothetical protein
MSENKQYANDNTSVTPSLRADANHENPSTQGKSAAEYTYEALELHHQQDKGKPPPALLQWIGDAALAVLPMNRMYCALGLTGGLMLGGNLAAIATGHGLDGKAIEKAKVPTFLQRFHGVVKDYDPANMLVARNRWIKYAQWGAYSLGGFIGIKLGTEAAYAKVHKRNADPKNLEDYLARVSMHQGDTWGWLAASAGIFGSASGLFALPIPGLNYALGLAGRTTSMQDRNIMIKGMNEWLSGASTTSYLRLREGMHYMCHYAAGSPAKDPAQLEYLAFTLLGPLFKDELTAEHIKQFVDVVHEVRDAYWQPGGIPKSKRKEAVTALKEVFTGAGLEALLINMGLNPASIEFTKLNGMVGKIGNIAAEEKVKTDEKAYLKLLASHVEVFEREGIISPERAQWVREGITARQEERRAPKWQAPAAGETFAPDPQPDEKPPLSQPLASSQQPEQPEAGKEPVAFGKEPSVSLGAKTKENPLDNLIKAAQHRPTDWREAALGERQRAKSPAFVVE